MKSLWNHTVFKCLFHNKKHNSKIKLTYFWYFHTLFNLSKWNTINKNFGTLCNYLNCHLLHFNNHTFSNHNFDFNSINCPAGLCADIWGCFQTWSLFALVQNNEWVDNFVAFTFVTVKFHAEEDGIMYCQWMIHVEINPFRAIQDTQAHPCYFRFSSQTNHSRVKIVWAQFFCMRSNPKG